MTRTCSRDDCESPIAEWNKTGVCSRCQREGCMARMSRRYESATLANDFLTDDTPAVVVLRIAEGVRV